MNKIFSIKSQMNILAILIILFIGRMVVPHLVILFAGYFFFFLSYLLYGLKHEKISRQFFIKEYLKKWTPMLLIMLMFIWGIAYSFCIENGIDLSQINYKSLLLKDFIHIFFYVFLTAAFFLMVKTHHSFKILLDRLTFYVFRLAVLISIIGLIKYIVVLVWEVSSDYFNIISLNYNASILSDYNSFAFVILLGLLSFLYIVYENSENTKIVNLSKYVFPLFLVSLYFSSSRRGFIIILVIIATILVLSFLPKVFHINLKRSVRKGLIAGLMVFVFLTIGVFLYSGFSLTDNNQSLSAKKFKSSVSSLTSRYLRIFSNEQSYHKVYENIWGYSKRGSNNDSLSTEEIKRRKLLEGQNGQNADDNDLSGQYGLFEDGGRRFGLNQSITVSRTNRFAYGYELFKSFNPTNKMLGKGFSYTTMFSEEFNTEVEHDYPHNFFISTVLYSGIIGLVFILLFLGYVFYTLIKAKTNFTFLLILLGLNFSFFLISGNTIFSSPVFFVTFIMIIHNYIISKALS